MKHTLTLVTSLLLAPLVALHAATATNPKTAAWVDYETAKSATPSPSPVELAYGTNPVQRIQLIQAVSKEPTPLLIFIHGGGWVGRSGKNCPDFLLKPLLKAGISVASITYRLLDEAQRDGVFPPVKAPMTDAARALQYIRSRSKELNIDKARIGSAGGSAGACTALWLALHDDLANPKSADPIARESTRLLFALAMDPQTTLDPVQMKAWIPNINYGGHAFGIGKGINGKPPVLTSGQFGQDSETFLARRKELLPLIQEYSPYALLTPDDPPLYLLEKVKTVLGQPEKDPTHSPQFGIHFAKQAKAVGVPCELNYFGGPTVEHPNPWDFIIQTFAQH